MMHSRGMVFTEFYQEAYISAFKSVLGLPIVVLSLCTSRPSLDEVDVDVDVDVSRMARHRTGIQALTGLHLRSVWSIPLFDTTMPI